MSIVQASVGDVNDDGSIDLKDAILALQVSAGLPSINIDKAYDVNDDSRIGIEEAICILQIVSNLRYPPIKFIKMAEDEKQAQDHAFTYLDTAMDITPQERQTNLMTISGITNADCTESECIITLSSGLTLNYFYPVEDEYTYTDFPEMFSEAEIFRRIALKSPRQTDLTCPESSKALILSPFSWQNFFATDKDSINKMKEYLVKLGYIVDIIENDKADRYAFELIKEEDYSIIIIFSHGGKNGVIATGTEIPNDYTLIAGDRNHYGEGKISCTIPICEYKFEVIKPDWWKDINLKNKLLFFAACNLLNTGNSLPSILSDPLTGAGAAVGFDRLAEKPHAGAFLTYVLFEAANGGCDRISDAFTDAKLSFSAKYPSKTSMSSDIATLINGQNFSIDQVQGCCAGFYNFYVDILAKEVQTDGSIKPLQNVDITINIDNIPLSEKYYTDSDGKVIIEVPYEKNKIYNALACHPAVSNDCKQEVITIPEYSTSLTIPIEFSFVSNAPTNINAVPDDKQITVSWDSVENANSYYVYKTVEPGITKDNWLDLGGIKIPANTSPLTLSDLTNDTTYFIVVTAVISEVESGMSSEVSATPTSSHVDLGMSFKLIPAGTFMMGSDTKHQVTLTKSFYMMTTEVTQGQWYAVMGSNPSGFKDCGDNCPVETVSWDDVHTFINKLNQMEGKTYRLPTEAEWEYAARAGSTTDIYNGEIINMNCTPVDSKMDAIGWYCGNSSSKTHPVAQKQPNSWGLYDMSGNVLEWCQDWYGSYPTSAVTDPTGPTTGKNRVYRGGSWYHAAGNCRSAHRESNLPSAAGSGLGFRLVLSQ